MSSSKNKSSATDPNTIYGEDSISTGLLAGGALSINTDTTKFDLGSGNGYIVDSDTDPSSPTITPITWAVSSAVTVTNILTQPVTYISINSSGAIVQESSIPDATKRRLRIFIGVVVHSDNTVVNAINDLPSIAYNTNAQLQDLMMSLGFRSESGNIIVANGSNLNLNKSAGIGFKAGANFQTLSTKPHQFMMAELIAATFRYRNQDSSEGSNVTAIDPTTYDDAGVTTTVPSNNNATIQRVFVFPSNLIRIQRGQEVFASFAAALDQVGTESFILETNISENGLFLGSIVCKKTATDLSSPAESKIIPAVSIAGNVGFETTLQRSYDISPTPEIETNSTNGAFTVKRGSAADTDSVIEVLDGSGNVVFSVTGEGLARALQVLTVKAGSFTPSPSEIGETMRMQITGATTITIADSTVSGLPSGASMIVNWESDSGSNSVTFATSGSQTIISTALGLSAVGAYAKLTYLGSNKWFLAGDLV